MTDSLLFHATIFSLAMMSIKEDPFKLAQSPEVVDHKLATIRLANERLLDTTGISDETIGAVVCLAHIEVRVCLPACLGTGWTYTEEVIIWERRRGQGTHGWSSANGTNARWTPSSYQWYRWYASATRWLVSVHRLALSP